MLTVEQALQAVLNQVQVSATTHVPLQDCLNLVLAKDLATPHDSPPFDKSMMDGFAVASAAFCNADERQLTVLETITAGTVPGKTVSQTSASRIMTGAPIPDGADCVVPIEKVTFSESNASVVTISGQHVAPENNVLRNGTSAKTGEPLMKAGTQLQPQHIAVLAEFGVSNVPVFQRSPVAVLATGDELLSIDEPLTAGRIRNSNEPMLVSQIQRAGATAIALGVAKDDRTELAAKIREGLKCDFMLLSGGVSAGTLDLVPSELAAAGVVQVFHKIQMKPGKPLWFGQLTTPDHTCWVFGLPGNPVSSMICFELFVRAAIRKRAGVAPAVQESFPATLTESISVRGDRLTYFPTHLKRDQTGLTATPVPWGGSADLRSTADANGMCLLHPKDIAYETGETVEAIFW